MKVLNVNKYYYPDVGGVETVCKQYSAFLSEQHQVTVLCIHKNFRLFGSTEFIDGVKVIRCSSLGTYFSMPVSLSFFFVYLRLLAKNDLVIFHLPFPLADLSLFLSSWFKRPLVSVWHSDIVKQGVLKKILSPFFKNTLKRSDKIVVTSPKMIELSDSLQSFADKCFVLPLSVNVSDINSARSSALIPPELNSELSIDAFFFGRLCYYKGVDVFINSLVLLSRRGIHPRVVIAGVGEYAQLIRQSITDYNLQNVIFIERFIDELEKYFLLSSTKCFVFPSVEKSEAFGIVQLESMAVGTPVINTHLDSGVPWVSLHGISGLTVEPKDAEALSHAIERLVTDIDYRDKLSGGAFSRVSEHFDDAAVKERLLKLVNDLI